MSSSGTNLAQHPDRIGSSELRRKHICGSVNPMDSTVLEEVLIYSNWIHYFSW
jgi:hypothetical protein